MLIEIEILLSPGRLFSVLSSDSQLLPSDSQLLPSIHQLRHVSYRWERPC